MLGRLAGLVVLGVLGGIVFGLSKKDDVQPAYVPSSSVAPPAPPRAPQTLVATAELPAKGFDLHDVLGQPKRVVDKVLGHSTQLDDLPWLYDAFDPVAVVVMYVNGRAARVMITPPGFHNTDADRRAVMAWVHHSDADDVDLQFKGDFEIGFWAPGEQDREAHRRQIGHALSAAMQATTPGSFASATGTVITFSPAPDDHSCSRAVLAQFRDALKGGPDDLTKVGFDMLECADGPQLKLR